MTEERVSFPSGSLKLEGGLGLPLGAGPHKGVVVCHPHPQYGGDMYNNVVAALCVALSRAGLAYFRFNFRGVGASQGGHTGGTGEEEDVLAALAYLGSAKEIDSAALGLVGYSFGAMVALMAALKEPKVGALALISLPIGTGIDVDSIKGYTKPKLFIMGDQDFFPAQALEEAVAGLAEPKECYIVPGADHFWGGRENLAAERTAQFFLNNLSPVR